MKILNLSDGEIVPHRLLLIDGESNIASDSVVQIRISCADSGISVFTKTNPNGIFRCLIALNIGKNTIILRNESYPDENATVNIVYERPNFIEHVRLLFIVSDDDCSSNCFPATRKLQVDWQREIQLRIILTAEILQLFIAEEMRRRYNRRLTFNLEDNHFTEVHKSACHLLKCKQTKRDFEAKSAIDLYWKVVQKILGSSCFDSNAKYLVFHTFSGHAQVEEANLGCGDVALVCAASVWSWPDRWEDVQTAFEGDNEFDKRHLPIGGSQTTIGSSYAVAVGAALHELCHSLDLVHTVSGVMGEDYVRLSDRFILSSEQLTVESNRCSFNNSQLALLKHHWWLNGRPKEDVANITIRNGCVACQDGISFVELRKDGHALASWSFDIYKPKLWLPPEEAVRVLSQKGEQGNFVLVVMSCKGVLTKLNEF